MEAMDETLAIFVFATEHYKQSQLSLMKSGSEIVFACIRCWRPFFAYLKIGSVSGVCSLGDTESAGKTLVTVLSKYLYCSLLCSLCLRVRNHMDLMAI